MAEAKHTPGPWETTKCDGDSGKWCIRACGSPSPIHAVAWTDVPDPYASADTVAANAALIAAAPDLLAACKVLVGFVADHCAERILAEESTYDPMLPFARAAIAKATGQPIYGGPRDEN